MSKVRVASKADFSQPGCKVYQVEGNTLALFKTDQGLFAIDNRCPHIGFPLDRGTVKDGILIATLGRALLREDQDFHTIQTVETAVSPYRQLQGRPEAGHVLIAAAR